MPQQVIMNTLETKKNETLSKERENIQEDKTEILNLVLNNK